ncbi:MAG: DUF2062 domain-containing protein, partial [Gammaproteobacteria bacterium]|nr:DUF2062 domain-containing protein [Gammaproteobacteria bacterium]
MPREFIKRYLPSPETISEMSLLKPVRHLLREPALWHLHRRSVGGACFIGMFVAFIPLPVQTPIAAVLAIWSRCNLPISMALVWTTNPLTMGPAFFFAYKLGAWLLGVELVITEIELSWSWLSDQFEQIWWPLVLGS